MTNEGNPIKRTFKNSVFTHLFSDPKYLFEAYKDLHPEDTETSLADLHAVTLQNVLVDAPYNDLGFTVSDRLVILVEAQSTWTPNIAVRAMLYFATTLKNWINTHDVNLYSSKRVRLPKPELYVIYSGEDEDIPESIVLSRDFYGGEPCGVDASVHVLRGEGDGIFSQYVEFARIGDEAVRAYGRTRKAAQVTIDTCIARGVLVDYLLGRRVEVEDIMIQLYDEEEVLRVFLLDKEREAAARGEKRGLELGEKRGLELGEKRGLELGLEKGQREIAMRMLRRGMGHQEVAELCGVPIERVAEFAATIQA